MWVVTYERHYRNEVYKSLTLRTPWWFAAEVVFSWWKFCYVMTHYPVKSVSIHLENDGVISLKDRRGLSENADKIRSLKRKAGWLKTRYDL